MLCFSLSNDPHPTRSKTPIGTTFAIELNQLIQKERHAPGTHLEAGAPRRSQLTAAAAWGCTGIAPIWTSAVARDQVHTSPGCPRMKDNVFLRQLSNFVACSLWLQERPLHMFAKCSQRSCFASELSLSVGAALAGATIVAVFRGAASAFATAGALGAGSSEGAAPD